jgi:hypothetical protein
MQLPYRILHEKQPDSKMKERIKDRKQRRFHVQTGVGAALGETKLGTVTTINKSGLTLSYLDFDDEGEKGRPGAELLTIIHDGGFSLHNIPCKILEQDYSPSQNYSGSLNINQCRLQFGRLTPAQISQLENFLDYFTDRPIDPLIARYPLSAYRLLDRKEMEAIR